jgi:replicative DNA helicase Mcm
MEMGRVLIDKAGMHADVQADASILGCCNPKNGKFKTDLMESIQSQINLPEPLMTRFDLIYIMKDKVNKERDEKILRSLLTTNKIRSPVSDKLFKKYINFASKLEPSMTEEVQDTFVSIISDLRQVYQKMENKDDKSAISFRQAGALIRLAVASAKLRLSEKVELVDLKLAEDLMLDALESSGFARDFNAIEYAALYGGTTSRKIKLLDAIKLDIKEFVVGGIVDEEILRKRMNEKGVQDKDFYKVFNNLREEGTLYGKHNDLRWHE